MSDIEFSDEETSRGDIFFEDFLALFHDGYIDDPDFKSFIILENESLPNPIIWLYSVVEKMSEHLKFPLHSMRHWFDGNTTEFESSLYTFFDKPMKALLNMYARQISLLFGMFIFDKLNGRIFLKSSKIIMGTGIPYDITEIRDYLESQSNTMVISKLNTSPERHGFSEEHNQSEMNQSFDEFEVYKRLTDISNSLPKDNLSSYHSEMLAAIEILAYEKNLQKDDMFKLMATFFTMNVLNSDGHQDKIPEVMKSDEKTTFKNEHDCFLPTEHLKINIPSKNCHVQVCSDCAMPDSKIRINRKPPLMKTNRSSLAMMFNFFSVLRNHSFRLVCIDAEDAFSTAAVPKYKGQCLLKNIGSAKIYCKMYELLVKKLEFKTVHKSSALFVHPEYGYALPYRTKILVLSKVPHEVYNLISNFMDATERYRDIDFLNCVFSPEPDCLEVESEEYIKNIYPTLFSDTAQEYIKEGADFLVSQQTFILDRPPLGQPSLMTDIYIKHLERIGQLRWPKGFVYDQTFNAEKLKRVLDVLNYITAYLRSDCEYQVAILNTYIGNPNKLVYFCLLHLFAYLTSDPVNAVCNALSKKSDLNIDMVLYLGELKDDPRANVRIHSMCMASFAENAWITKCEIIDITELGPLAERIMTVHSLLEEILLQLPSINSLSLVGYDKKPKFRIVCFDFTFYMALQNKTLSDPETKTTVEVFKKVLEIIDLLDIKIVYEST